MDLTGNKSYEGGERERASGCGTGQAFARVGAVLFINTTGQFMWHADVQQRFRKRLGGVEAMPLYAV